MGVRTSNRGTSAGKRLELEIDAAVPKMENGVRDGTPFLFLGG
jgi:hypothetical protein